MISYCPMDQGFVPCFGQSSPAVQMYYLWHLHSSVDLRYFCLFGQYASCCYEHSWTEFLGGHMLSPISGLYPGVKLLGPMLTLHLTFRGTATLVFKVAVPFYSHRQCMEFPTALHLCQHLLSARFSVF